MALPDGAPPDGHEDEWEGCGSSWCYVRCVAVSHESSVFLKMPDQLPSWFSLGNVAPRWLATYGRHGELWIQHPQMSWWGRWSLWDMIPHDGDEVLEHGRFVWWCPQRRGVP